MSKSEHKLNNIFWKLHLSKIIVFSLLQLNCYYNLIVFSENNYTKQVQTFHQSLYTVKIFFNSIFKKNHWTWTWKTSNCYTGIIRSRLTLWYNGFAKNTWTALLESDWFYDILESDLKSTQTTLLDLQWFYDILDLDLKNTRTNLMNCDWF